MTFTTPFALLLLLTLPYFVWLGWPRVRLRHKGREWVSLGLRLLIMLLLILSLAGSQTVHAADELAVLFLIDGSDSIRPAQAQQAENFVRETIAAMPVTDRAAVVVFGANGLVERPLSNLTELAPITSVPQRLHTDLAEAIRLGLALFPAGSARRIVIISDGNATIGDAESAARLAAASGIPLDYFHLSRANNDVEVSLIEVDAPNRVTVGETFRLDILAESNQSTAAQLRVLADGGVIHEERVQLSPGSNRFSVRLQANEQTFARYRVQLTPDNDTYFQNNELATFTDVAGPPRVLLVAQDGFVAEDGTAVADESLPLRLALEATGLAVDRITPTELPASLAQLSSYATIVLVNVNAKHLSPRKMSLLQSYVRDLGGGLVAVGGPESYGMGGYFRTPLEETLPVEMQIKDQERFPSVSIVIVIDRSGSMGQQEGSLTKIQLASEGAVRVVELLNDFDEITVIPVDTQPDNQIGPLPASDKETLINLIRQIGAGGGGIYVRTGLEAAAAALEGSSNQIKHIILLADGSDSEEKEGAPELIEALVATGVTLSTVSIGGGPDTAWLEEMAALGNGRFHFTDQAANLPQIFTQETTNIQRSYLIEERFFPTQTSASPILAGIRSVPPLLGYVGTSSKATAQVILTTHQGDPLLAAWQYGLGRSVAWTSDATGRWGTEWVRWEGFPAFWAQAVRWTITEGRNESLETAVSFNDEQALLTVDARDANGNFLHDLELDANIVAPDGEVNTVTLQQVAPGRYEAAFTPQEEGAYLLRVAGATLDGATAVGQTAGWVLGYSPEYRDLTASPQLLAQLAEMTGGRDLTGLEVGAGETAVFNHNLPSQPTTRPIWLWLTLVALLLLPIDIAVRRLVVTRQDMARAWAATFGRLQPVPAPVPQRTQQVSRLFDAKERAKMTDLRGAVEVDVEKVEEDVEEEGKRPLPKPSPPQPKPIPPASGSLAARLLEKRKEQERDS